jgi:hypothetical protein
MELTGFFPVPERANAALDLLREAGFNVTSASIVTGEDAKSALHKRLAAAKRGRAAAGALACGSLSLILAVLLVAPTQPPFPWIAVASFVALSGLLGAAIGGYYGMGVEKESVLVGVMVPRERVGEAINILRAAGGRFINIRPVTSDSDARRSTMHRPTVVIRHDR